MNVRSVFNGLLAVSISACLSFSVHAQGFPSRPVTMIVPFASGGTGEILGRLLAKEMAEELGQTVVVELKPGAGSMLGSEYVADSAAPDGYTLLLNGPPLSINKSLMNLRFDPGKDLVPITGVAGFANLMVTSAKSPYKTVADVIKAARTEHLTFGSSGLGTASHMAGELFDSIAGVQMTHIPYRGSGAVYTDLIAQRVTVLFDLSGSAVGFVNNGDVRALGITSKERSSAMPNVPTLAEQGVPGYEFLSWFGLFVRSGTPAEANARLELAARKALAHPEFAKKIKELGALPMMQSSAEFSQFYQADIRRWASLVQDGKVARLN